MWLWYMEACGGVGGKGVLTFTRVQNQREFLPLLRGSQQQGSYSQGIPLQCPLLHLLTQFSPLREWKHSLKATWLWTWLQRARQTAPSMGWVFTLRCENLWTATMLGLYEDLPPHTNSTMSSTCILKAVKYHLNKRLAQWVLQIALRNSLVCWMSC